MEKEKTKNPQKLQPVVAYKTALFLDLGSPITDVFAFLEPIDQHKLRRTCNAMCEWFDSAAENGSLAFFATFASETAAVPLRWKHSTGNPRGAWTMHEVSDADSCPPPLQATVTVHARNYYLSTFNAEARGEAATADDDIIDNAIIHLVANFAFEHKLVITGLFGIRSIGDDFCDLLKASAIEFNGEGSQLQSVGKCWLFECEKLRSVTFSGFAALEAIGDYWLCDCPSIESIIFTENMSNLKKVGGYWMYKASKLKHVDLTGFTALEEVGDYWMYKCSGLEGISFASLMPNLRKVGYSWMSCCSMLQHFNLTGFTALEEVGKYWLSHCSSLDSVFFASNIPRLKKVGSSWMSNCEKLQHVDLTGCNALEEVGEGCLLACSSLRCVMIPALMPHLKKVGNKWTPQSDCSLSDYLLHLSKLEY